MPSSPQNNSALVSQPRGHSGSSLPPAPPVPPAPAGPTLVEADAPPALVEAMLELPPVLLPSETEELLVFEGLVLDPVAPVVAVPPVVEGLEALEVVWFDPPVVDASPSVPASPALVPSLRVVLPEHAPSVATSSTAKGRVMPPG